MGLGWPWGELVEAHAAAEEADRHGTAGDRAACRDRLSELADEAGLLGASVLAAATGTLWRPGATAWVKPRGEPPDCPCDVVVGEKRPAGDGWERRELPPLGARPRIPPETVEALTRLLLVDILWDKVEFLMRRADDLRRENWELARWVAQLEAELKAVRDGGDQGQGPGSGSPGVGVSAP